MTYQPLPARFDGSHWVASVVTVADPCIVLANCPALTEGEANMQARLVCDCVNAATIAHE